jgi:hypothetical protein
MTSICIDRLMGFRLVSNLAIVDWAFSPPLLPTFHVSELVWEVSPAQDTHTRRPDAAVGLRATALLRLVAVAWLHDGVPLRAPGLLQGLHCTAWRRAAIAPSVKVPGFPRLLVVS